SSRTVLATCSLVVLLFLCRPGTAAAQPGAPPDPLDVDRAMARARLAADQATFADLARQRVEAAEESHYHCMHPNPWLCGPEYDCVRGALVCLLPAALARSGEAGAGPTLEMLWRHAWMFETKEESKWACGRISIAEYLDSRFSRLELQKARAARKDAG